MRTSNDAGRVVSTTLLVASLAGIILAAFGTHGPGAGALAGTRMGAVLADALLVAPFVVQAAFVVVMVASGDRQAAIPMRALRDADAWFLALLLSMVLASLRADLAPLADSWGQRLASSPVRGSGTGLVLLLIRAIHLFRARAPHLT